ncbi:MAG TPA: nitroreductase family protein [Candidatus Limnocylindrales bacterium]|nr:nitroreductase family protein [Candidatus Limnocylindrales bacterium]
MDVLEAMHTCRAMRYLRSDPVPHELIVTVLEAAICAPSPGNSQGWDFVVVRDRATLDALAAVMRPAIQAVLPPIPEQGDATRRRMLAGAHHLVESIEKVPAWIFVCGRPVYPPGAPTEGWIWPAVYPAAQNILLAARALGLGATFTTYHMLAEAGVRSILSIPAEARIAVSIPLGWPEKPFGPVRRRPLEEFVHWDRW